MVIKFCDFCNYEIQKQGRLEPEYVHLHGSVFCMTTVATYKGKHYLKRNEGCD